MTMVSVMRAALGFTMLAGLAVTPALAQQPPVKPRPAVAAPAPAAHPAAGAQIAQAPAPRPAQQQQAAAPSAPAAAAAVGGSKSSGEVIARVGHFELTADDIKTQLTGLGAREQNALIQNPGLLRQTVNLMLASKLVMEQVQEKKFDQQPAIAAQLERVRENAITELYLASVSTPPAGFPSDDEVQKVYDANKSSPSLVIPRQFQLSQILVALPKGSDKAAEDKAKAKVADVVKKVKAPGADFAAIAKSDSDAGAERGGEVGWLAETQIPGEIRAQVVALAKGAVSEPMQLEDGFHIIKVTDIKASYTASLAEVKDQLVAQMRNERAAALRRAYIADLMNKNPPVVNEFALSKLVETK
jgi:parvulin-like peptidyl-prolyl isomerase